MEGSNFSPGLIITGRKKRFLFLENPSNFFEPNGSIHFWSFHLIKLWMGVWGLFFSCQALTNKSRWRSIHGQLCQDTHAIAYRKFCHGTTRGNLSPHFHLARLAIKVCIDRE